MKATRITTKVKEQHTNCIFRGADKNCIIEFLMLNSHTKNGNHKVGSWYGGERGMLRVQGSRIQSRYSLFRRSSLLRGELLVAGVRVKLQMARTLLQIVSLSLCGKLLRGHMKRQSVVLV